MMGRVNPGICSSIQHGACREGDVLTVTCRPNNCVPRGGELNMTSGDTTAMRVTLVSQSVVQLASRHVQCSAKFSGSMSYFDLI